MSKNQEKELETIKKCQQEINDEYHEIIESLRKENKYVKITVSQKGLLTNYFNEAVENCCKKHNIRNPLV